MRQRVDLPVHVDVRTVPIGFAELVGTIQDFETLFVRSRGAIKGRESHGTETERRDLRAVFAQLAGGYLSCHCCDQSDSFD